MEVKRYVTKYALTAGIEEMNLRPSNVAPGMLCPTNGFSNFYEGKDAFENRSDAVNNAEKQRLRKIASLRKQIEKLEKLRFS